MSTLKGAFCSPASSLETKVNGGSCYTKNQLKSMINAWNKKNPKNKIQAYGSKDQLWNRLDSVLKNQCKEEMCWAKATKANIDVSKVFRPKRPGSTADPNAWLSTDDIEAVLIQYQEVYSDFLFLGPFPIDFCNIGAEICNINLWTTRSKGKRRIGIVFNTDPSSKPGQHWVSMFIDLASDNQLLWEAAYFDSYGKAQLPKEIQALIKHIKAQMPFIKLKLNCSDALCTISKQHQRGPSECGVYSLFFITERLKGRKWEDIVVHQLASDSQMSTLRNSFFYKF
jgi:hypothetical protein